MGTEPAIFDAVLEVITKDEAALQLSPDEVLKEVIAKLSDTGIKITSSIVSRAPRLSKPVLEKRPH